MKLLYLDCYMGAAGDMLMAALLALLPEPEGYVERMNSLLSGRAQVSCTKDEKCGISGLHVSVTVNGEEEDEHLHEHHHHHHHTGVGEICGMIDAMDIPDVVKSDAKAVFTLVAEAEGPWRTSGEHSLPRARHSGRTGRRTGRVPAAARTRAG